MNFMKRPNDVVAALLTGISALCVAVLVALVLYSVVMRYIFNNAPDYVEPIALLMVIVIAFFGAALKVRDGGHIGLDSLVEKLPPRTRQGVHVFQQLCLITFAVAVCWGCWTMVQTTADDPIPIIGLPEATRYYVPLVAGVCVVLFALEQLLELFSRHQRT